MHTEIYRQTHRSQHTGNQYTQSNIHTATAADNNTLIHIYIQINKHTNKQQHTYTPTHLHTYIHTCIHTCRRVHTYIYIFRYTHTIRQIHTNRDVHTSTYIDTYKPTEQSNNNTYAYIHRQRHIQNTYIEIRTTMHIHKPIKQ